MKRETGKKFFQQLDKKPVTRKTRLQESFDKEMRNDEKRKGPKVGVYRTASETPLRTNEVRSPRPQRPARPGAPGAGPRSGGPRPRTFTPREEDPRDAKRRSFAPREDNFRDSAPRTPREGGPRSFGPPRDNNFRDRGPRDGDSRSSGPRSFGPPRENNFRDSAPRTPREGGPRSFGPPRDNNFRDRGPRDGDSRSSGPRSFGPPRDGGPRSFGPPRTGTGPRDGKSRVSGPRDGGAPRSFGPRGPRPERHPGADAFSSERPLQTPRTGTPHSKAIRLAPRPHTEDLRLNRYIAQSGVCSRRDADTLITNGQIKVNGEIVREMGHKVRPGKDRIEYNGKAIHPQNFVYLLLNKPKNYITTMEDPEGRNTVMQLVTDATNERIYPVGRLDRNTTGLLLMTNDGEMAERLMHPSHRVRKIYAVRLDRDLTPEDMDRLLQGIELEDGMASVDKISFIEGRPMNEVGVEIHLGKNRIVRRLFEGLGYTVEALDRTLIGSLTKKLLPRGKWRMLTEQEVAFLKML